MVTNKDTALAAPIRLIISDVDGVLSDGRITLDNSGIESKSFHVRDGLGIKLWQKCGFHFAILTARNSQVVKLRAAELGVPTVRQGFSDKLPAAREIMSELGVTPEETCYIGDDLPDLPPIYEVALPVAVGDAAEEVQKAATWTTHAGGGKGAVRELVRRLLVAKGRWDDCVPRPPAS